MCIQEVASLFSLEPTIMISASIRIFSAPTVVEVTGLSRTTIWRRRRKAQSDASQTRKSRYPDPAPGRGFYGMDVVNYVQARRAEAGLPPADEDAYSASPGRRRGRPYRQEHQGRRGRENADAA